MAKHHKLELTETEIQALVELRDKGEPAYLRERATVLLKIHQGSSPHEVACKGLLKARDPDTVYAWLRRYREHGLLGLSNKPGRGRKPAFSPKWTGKLSKKIGTLAKLPIEIVQLPTYASWTNPIEKLWRWARQSVIHLHRLSNDWQTLQEKVLAFMEQFKGGSQPLLRYVGLLPN